MLTNPPYGTTWKQDIDNLNVGTGKENGIKLTNASILKSKTSKVNWKKLV
jgi:hypothetical protein